MQDAIRKLAKLNEASRAMTRCRELGPLLDTILRLVCEVFDLDTCAVLLLDESTRELRIERARGYDEAVIATFRGRMGEGVTGRAAQTGRAMYVADVHTQPDYVEGVVGAVSEIAAPMRLDDDVIGVLDAEMVRPARFDETDLQVFAAFADHAAVAVHNARLHERLAARKEQLETQVHRLELIGKASRALSSSLHLDQVLQTILSLLHEALKFDHCAVLLFNGTEGTLKVRASIGYDRSVSELRIPVGVGVTGQVARTGKPLLVRDVSRTEQYIPGVVGGRCEMAVPLVVRGQAIGVLDAESTKAGAFDEDDLDLLATFAVYAATAIDNAEAYRALEEANAKLHRNVLEIQRMNRDLLEHTRIINETNAKLEHRVNELLTLQEASRTIASSLDLDETLEAIVTMTRAIIRSSMSAIKLVDEETHEVRVRVRQCDAGVDDAPEPAELLGIPLRIGDRTIGQFEVARAAAGGFTEEERRLIETLASQAAVAIENARLFENTQRTYFETIRSLAQALEARDAYTKGHSERVMRYSLRIADAMGIPEADRKLIGHASLLHDIGKIGIADAVLNKPGTLTPEDRRAIESHPIWGDSIIGPIRFLEKVQTLVRHHHERFDGSGYPDGLRGQAIPLGARVIAVADAFDAMTSTRPYRAARSKQEALVEIKRGAGSQFDPVVVEAFVRLMEGRTGMAPGAEPDRG